jgi:hypothetical protein
MGDKSPKSKKRNQQQKTAVKDEKAAKAKAKQDRQSTGDPKKNKKAG